MTPLRTFYYSILQRGSPRKIGYTPASSSDPDFYGSGFPPSEKRTSTLTWRRRRILLAVVMLAGLVMLSLGYIAAVDSVGKTGGPVEIVKESGTKGTTTPGEPEYYVRKALGGDPTFISPSDPKAKFFPIVPSRNVFGPDRPKTPLFISFAKNYKMLEQVVLGYIAAGWPREDIIVLDNSGTMNANKRKVLSRENPFYMDYEKLVERYGINVFRTPTLLNFAQMQNFFISIALEAGWEYFYWSHMDVVLLTEEELTPYKSAYQRIVEDLEAHLIHWNQSEKLEHATRPGVRYKPKYEGERKDVTRGHGINVNLQMPDDIKMTDWAHRYYTNDWLSLINVGAMEKVGAWDTFIPYYTTDCDFLGRMKMSGLEVSHGYIGRIFDVATRLADPEGSLFPSVAEEAANSERYKNVKKSLEEMMHRKTSGFRNTWQKEMKGGQGEPWTYNSAAFDVAWKDTNDCGGHIYDKKWGFGKMAPRNGCSLIEGGKRLGDMWKNVKI